MFLDVHSYKKQTLDNVQFKSNDLFVSTFLEIIFTKDSLNFTWGEDPATQEGYGDFLDYSVINTKSLDILAFSSYFYSYKMA